MNYKKNFISERHFFLQYDDILGRFMSIDPLWYEQINWSPYHYCGNDPVNGRDPDGLLPGDLFDTPDQAAHDFGKNYNGISIEHNKEISAYIYIKSITKDNNKIYTYSYPVQQSKDEAIIYNFKNAIVFLHTHAGYDPQKDNNNFSNEDKKISVKFKKPIYVVTPDGSLKKYDPSTKKTTILTRDMPRDSKDPSTRKNKTPEFKNEEIRKIPLYTSPNSQGYGEIERDK